MNNEDKDILIELIIERQLNMIIEDRNNHDSDKYKQLEKLKVKVKSM